MRVFPLLPLRHSRDVAPAAQAAKAAGFDVVTAVAVKETQDGNP